jgi:hypothetical protein
MWLTLLVVGVAIGANNLAVSLDPPRRVWRRRSSPM